MIPQHPLPQREEDRQAPTATDDRQKPEKNEPTIPQSPPPDADYQDQFAQQPLKAKIQSIASPQILMDTTAVSLNLEPVRVRTRKPCDDVHPHPPPAALLLDEGQITTNMILVQIRKELANMPLATIPINVKKDDNTTKVITSRMDRNITIVWELLIATGPLSRKLRTRDLIWSVSQSPILKHPTNRCTSPVSRSIST